jgi:nucleoside-diphosphate-sugar epimerase
MAEAAKRNNIKRLFYSSSACIYPIYKQEDANVVALKESDAYPAEPDNEYGWEKIFSERLYKSYGEFYEVRIARFHNIFGPEGTYDGGREKAPAALCRKIAVAKDGDVLEVWGDGKQTRSFCYIDDCLEGVYRLMNSDFKDPLNIGSDRLVSIDEMIDIISKISEKKEFFAKEIIDILSFNSERKIKIDELSSIIYSATKKSLQKKYLLDKPQGVRGRNSDNSLCREVLNWEPQISLEEGLEKTYNWINLQINKS